MGAKVRRENESGKKAPGRAPGMTISKYLLLRIENRSILASQPREIATSGWNALLKAARRMGADAVLAFQIGLIHFLTYNTCKISRHTSLL